MMSSLLAGAPVKEMPSGYIQEEKRNLYLYGPEMGVWSLFTKGEENKQKNHQQNNPLKPQRQGVTGRQWWEMFNNN